MPINIDESSSNVIALQYLLNVAGSYVTHWAEKQLYYTTNGNKKKYSLHPVFFSNETWLHQLWVQNQFP